MKLYGLKITRKDTKVLEVYFQSLSYIDWTIYSQGSEMFDPATVRYLINAYVARATLDGEEITPVDLSNESPSVVQKLITNMFQKSMFSDEDKLAELMNSFEQRSRTLSGCYDLFIFLNMGADFYLQMLTQDVYTRTQIITMVEQATNINVKERFDTAVTKKIPLDLSSNQDQYKRNMRKHGQPVQRNPLRENPLREHQRNMEQQQPTPKEKMPSSVDSMLAESREALGSALNAGKTKERQVDKSVFNWSKDEAQYGQFNKE